MDITFELDGNQKVLIRSGERVIGHIFSPAGTGHDIKNAIQICGFDEAYCLWGCGVFGKRLNDKIVEKPLNKDSPVYNEMLKIYPDGIKIERIPQYQMKKDIQLLFEEYDNSEQYNSNFTITKCGGCYNDPCNCENKSGNPFTVKKEIELQEKLELTDKRKSLRSALKDEKD